MKQTPFSTLTTVKGSNFLGFIIYQKSGKAPQIERFALFITFSFVFHWPMKRKNPPGLIWVKEPNLTICRRDKSIFLVLVQIHRFIPTHFDVAAKPKIVLLKRYSSSRDGSPQLLSFFYERDWHKIQKYRRILPLIIHYHYIYSFPLQFKKSQMARFFRN